MCGFITVCVIGRLVIIGFLLSLYTETTTTPTTAIAAITDKDTMTAEFEEGLSLGALDPIDAPLLAIPLI
jgi:hypothetical protein